MKCNIDDKSSTYFSVPGYKCPPVEANFSRTPLPPNERVGSGRHEP